MTLVGYWNQGVYGHPPGAPQCRSDIAEQAGMANAAVFVAVGCSRFSLCLYGLPHGPYNFVITRKAPLWGQANSQGGLRVQNALPRLIDRSNSASGKIKAHV